MTAKRLNFPSMDGGDNDLFIQNESGEYEQYKPPSWADDELDDLLDDDETGGDESGDATLDGEKAAYERAMELTAGEDNFQYFPAENGEESNQRFSMAHLEKAWGAATKHNIGIANFFYKNFLEKGLRQEAEHTGIASHYLMVQAFYKAAKHAEKLATQQSQGEPGMKKLRVKGMDGVMQQRLEERCCDLASRVYSDAKAKIIEMHGGISNA
jgi:hypothetical protein